MTGTDIRKRSTFPLPLALVAAFWLAACDENGEFAFPSADSGTTEASTGDVARVQTTTTEQDVERPDIFEVTDRGLWDGRPSLGGIWVAHPDVTDPERAIIRNTANGQSIVGALFRRERENPGPPLQISSDAAEELGILAGAPTEISVIALRREEVTVETEVPAENPVVAGLAAPVTVASTPLDPVEGAAAAIDAAEAPTEAQATAQPLIDVELPPANPAAPAVAVSLPPAGEAPEVEAADDAVETVLPTGGSIQIGIFSVERNANEAAQTLRDAGIPTSVIAQEAGGRTVWRVESGPAQDEAARDATLTQIKGLGFVDAFPIDS